MLPRSGWKIHGPISMTEIYSLVLFWDFAKLIRGMDIERSQLIHRTEGAAEISEDRIMQK
jgi:hypothetical protein